MGQYLSLCVHVYLGPHGCSVEEYFPVITQGRQKDPRLEEAVRIEFVKMILIDGKGYYYGILSIPLVKGREKNPFRKTGEAGILNSYQSFLVRFDYLPCLRPKLRIIGDVRRIKTVFYICRIFPQINIQGSLILLLFGLGGRYSCPYD
jgi:hypothetical protein